MVSIIMPVRLEPYKTQCSNAVEKFFRAINSVLCQNYEDWELIIISDGCEKSYSISFSDKKIKQYFIEKGGAGAARNEGIRRATGDIITYLDADDVYGRNHISIIADEFNEDYTWVYFNDYIYNNHRDEFIERVCNIRIAGQCGTSNISHRKMTGCKWPENTRYGYDDYFFIQSLLKSSGKYKKISTPYYYVMHIPYRYDL